MFKKLYALLLFVQYIDTRILLTVLFKPCHTMISSKKKQNLNVYYCTLGLLNICLTFQVYRTLYSDNLHSVQINTTALEEAFVPPIQPQSINFSHPLLQNRTKSTQLGVTFYGELDQFGNMRKALRALHYSESPIQESDFIYTYNAQQVHVNKSLLELIKKNIKPFKKIALIPGMEKISFKENLGKHKFPWTAKSFQMPEQLDEAIKYAQLGRANEKMFLKKKKSHSGISFIDPIDFKNVREGYFIEEVIHPPLLIDGYKFDLSKHVVITSVKPLRVYVQDEVLIRFFQTKYEKQTKIRSGQFPPNTDSTYGMLGYPQGTLMNVMLEETLQKRNINATLIHLQMDDIVLKTFKSIENTLYQGFLDLDAVNGQLYQHMRWDFLVKEDESVHLIEVNDSPFLGTKMTTSSVAHNRQMGILNSILGLAGVADWTLGNQITTESMGLDQDHCNSPICTNNCLDLLCRLCFRCLSKVDLENIIMAFKEHEYKGVFHRITPKTKDCAKINKQSNSDILELWYCHMCELNKSWCI